MTFLDKLLDLEKAPLAIPYTEQGYSLDRFAAFVESLGSPQRQLRFIHIAGTKGKGSTAALCEAIFIGLGWPTAMFSSPHLAHFGERFRLDGRPLTREEFDQACDAFWEGLGDEQRRGFLPPAPWRTVFEALTALALVEFQRHAEARRRSGQTRPTIVAWETGLGGRLDCTNIVDPVVSVITTLGMDHVRILGDSIEKIAYEKAGIIKPGRPVVVARQQPEFHDRVWPVILAKASEVGSPVIRAWEHNPVADAGDDKALIQLPDGRESRVSMPLRGSHQLRNLEAAVAACWVTHRALAPAGESFHVEGVAHTRWPGRLEILTRDGQPRLILDGAHCPLSAKALAESLAHEARPADDPPLLLLGMQRDKDAAGFLRAFDPTAIRLVVYTVGGARGATAGELATAARAADHEPAALADSAEEAWNAALALRPTTIVAAGTLYTLDKFRRLYFS